MRPTFSGQFKSAQQLIRFQAFLAGKLQSTHTNPTVCTGYANIRLTIGLQSSGSGFMRMLYLLCFKDFQNHRRSVGLYQFCPRSRIGRQTTDKIINPLDRLVPVDATSILEYFGSRTQFAQPFLPAERISPYLQEWHPQSP